MFVAFAPMTTSFMVMVAKPAWLLYDMAVASGGGSPLYVMSYAYVYMFHW